MQWPLPVQDHGPREMDVPSLIQWSCQLVCYPTCSMVKGCDYVIRVQHGMTTFQPQRSMDVAFDPRAR